MKALIVGGAGFLGANLARACLRDGATVTVVDSLEPRLRASIDSLREIRERIEFVQGDMRDLALMKKLVADHEVIFSVAAQTSHTISMSDPLFDVDLNCTGHLSLLEAVRQANSAAVVVYSSTSTVVGRASRSPIDETHPESPLDIYSSNKLAGEKYYRIYHTAHGLKTIALRFANLYGPYGRGIAELGFVNYFLHLAWSGEEIRLFGSGAQLRNLLFVDDACSAMLLAARTPELFGEAVFVTHDEHISIADLSKTIVDTFGRGRVTHVEWPEERKKIEVHDQSISSAKFRSLTNWRPTKNLVEGLEITRGVFAERG